MNIRPLHDRLIVLRLEESTDRVGAIIIPDSAKEKPQQGKVIAVGKGKVKDDGKNIPLDVKEGDTVDKGQTLGRSGTTGLAGGDHLHFTMLLGGRAITPIDWWSEQWVQDRVLRKLREASAPDPAPAPATATAGAVPGAPAAPAPPKG